MASANTAFDGDATTNRLGVPNLVFIGAAVAAVGLGMRFGFGNESSPGNAAVAAVSCAFAGVIIMGLGIPQAPKNSIALLLAAVGSWFAMQATHPAWDSAQLLFLVAAGCAVVAAIVVALPSYLQKLFVSCVVVFHFGGVFSAITSPPPQPAVSNWAWVLLYRPHLVFCYTNNAYQFYSPDPGPASLVWFLVEFEDGKKTWYKMPRKPESRLDPMAVEFFRRLSLTEAVNQNMSIPGPPHGVLERRRLRTDIPLYPGMEVSDQYRLPQEIARRLLSSYARHLANDYSQHGKVKSIKIYRVLHRMMDPQQFAAGEDPFDPVTYLPYFMGEYFPDGTLKDANDPMLFWLVPIVRAAAPLTPLTAPGKRPQNLKNYLADHAGADPFDKATEGTP